MNKEEVLQEIKNTEDSIKNLSDKMEQLKAELNKPEISRWKPFGTLTYYFVGSDGIVWGIQRSGTEEDLYRYNIRNCFRTREEAQAKADHIKTHYELMDIADELNAGQKIDWNDSQYKYYLIFDYFNGEIEDITTKYTKYSSVIYCLSDKFKDVSLSRIGEERLKQYLTYSEQ